MARLVWVRKATISSPPRLARPAPPGRSRTAGRGRRRRRDARRRASAATAGAVPRRRGSGRPPRSSRGRAASWARRCCRGRAGDDVGGVGPLRRQVVLLGQPLDLELDARRGGEFVDRFETRLPGRRIRAGGVGRDGGQVAGDLDPPTSPPRRAGRRCRRLRAGALRAAPRAAPAAARRRAGVRAEVRRRGDFPQPREVGGGPRDRAGDGVAPWLARHLRLCFHRRFRVKAVDPRPGQHFAQPPRRFGEVESASFSVVGEPAKRSQPRPASLATVIA